jgi:glyoxylate/hydroxypyruvate reductase A
MSIVFAATMDGAERAEWLALLRAALPGETLLDAGADRIDPDAVDVAIVANPPPGALQGLPKLAFVQSLWAGVDRLLGDATVPPALPIARMVDPAMNAAMAETALWATLSLHRGFFAYAARQRAGQWRQHAQRRADEIGVAVLGLGQMGRAAARRIAAQGYRVTGWSRSAAQAEGLSTTHGGTALEPLLRAADVVVNLLPLTEATRGLFDARRLAWLKKTAGLVNLARGAHVVDADLLAALDAGALRHAVLDVFSTEPLPADHRYWSHPRVTVLPHAAALTDARSAAAVAAANVLRFRRGEVPQHLVDRTRGY